KVSGRVGQEAARHECPLLDKGVAAVELDKKEKDVQRNQRERDNGKGSSAGVVVADWEHRALLLWTYAAERMHVSFQRRQERRVTAAKEICGRGSYFESAGNAL